MVLVGGRPAGEHPDRHRVGGVDRRAGPEVRDTHNTPLDLPGTALSLVGITALVFGIIEGPNLGWSSPEVLAGFAAAAVTLVGFVVRERHARHPMLPLELFADRRFSVGSGVVTVTFFAMIGFFFLNTLYLQFVRGDSPLFAGLAAVPVAIMQVLVAPRSSSLSERFGSGPVIAVGFTFISSGFAVLAFAAPSWPYLPLGAAYVLLGTGMGITAAPATGNIMSAVPDAKAGVGSAVNDTTREFGGALGIAVLGSIIVSAYQANLRIDDLGLGPEQVAAAKDSVGAASQIARSLPGAEPSWPTAPAWPSPALSTSPTPFRRCLLSLPPSPWPSCSAPARSAQQPTPLPPRVTPPMRSPPRSWAKASPQRTARVRRAITSGMDSGHLLALHRPKAASPAVWGKFGRRRGARLERHSPSLS